MDLYERELRKAIERHMKDIEVLERELREIKNKEQKK